MKKIRIVVIAVTLFLTSTVHAQPGGDGPMQGHERSEKVEAMKVAFFTQRLDLSVEEAKVFWPVYNQYQTELNALRDERREQIKNYIKNNQKMTEKEYADAADAEIDFRQDELNIMKKYHEQLKQVMSSKKLAQLYKAENDFKRELLRQIQDNNRKSGGRSPGNKPGRN